MGYEVIYKFHKRNTDGPGYNTTESDTFRKIVGDQWDEVDLDEVAKNIMGNMARRDVWIVDFEVFEYTKRKISCREGKDGLVIKNKKFSYDITGKIKSDEVVTQESIPVQSIVNANGLQPHEIIQPGNAVIKSPVQQDISHLPLEVQQEITQMRKSNQMPAPAERMTPILPTAGSPIRFEIYDPHPQLKAAAEARKLPFTIGKKYPIFEERPDPRHITFGMVYLTKDDTGKMCKLNDKHFVPVQAALVNDFPDESRPNHMGRVATNDNQFVANGKVMNLPDIFTLGNRRR